MSNNEDKNIPTEAKPDAEEQEVEVKDEEVVELTKEEHAELIEKLANETQARVNLQGEIKDLRTKKTEVPEVEPNDIEKAVNAKFEERQLGEVKANQDKALDKFFKAHPEFDQANDAGGLMFAKFQKNLARLNTTNATSAEDFESVFEDTLNLMGHKSDEGNAVPSKLASTPGSKASPDSSPTTKFEGAEAKLVEGHFKGDGEAYLKMKAKRPAYVDTLLEFVQ